MSEQLHGSKESQTPLDWCESFVRNFNTRTRELTEAEKRLHEEARMKLGGILPKDFYRGALKQTTYGAGLLALQMLVAPSGIGYPLLGYGGAFLYEDNVKKGAAKHPEMRFLEAEDWIAGILVNPVIVGGIRNLWKGRQILMDIDRQFYAQAAPR